MSQNRELAEVVDSDVEKFSQNSPLDLSLHEGRESVWLPKELNHRTSFSWWRIQMSSYERTNEQRKQHWRFTMRRNSFRSSTMKYWEFGTGSRSYLGCFCKQGWGTDAKTTPNENAHLLNACLLISIISFSLPYKLPALSKTMMTLQWQSKTRKHNNVLWIILLNQIRQQVIKIMLTPFHSLPRKAANTFCFLICPWFLPQHFAILLVLPRSKKLC